MSDQEDFEKIKGCLIYLDTNVMSYLHRLPEKDSDLRKKIRCLEFLLFQGTVNLDVACVPYSHAHLRDALQSDESSAAELLGFISRLSRNWKVSSEPNTNSLRFDKVNNIVDDFIQLKTSTEKARQYQEMVDAAFKPIFAAQAKLTEQQMSATSIGLSKDLRELIIQTIENYSSNTSLEILKLNKRLRSVKIELKGSRVRYPNITPKDLEQTPDEIISAINSQISRSGLPFKNFDDIFKLVPNSLITDSQFLNKVLKYSHMSDFIGLSNEKLNKKTSFDGIITDNFHLEFGLRSNIFVTEDQNLLIKARFIKKMLSLPVAVFDVEDFNRLVLKKILPPKESDIPVTRTTVTLKFNDDNGHLLDEYSISL